MKPWMLTVFAQVFLIGLMLGLCVGREQGKKQAQADVCDGGAR